MAALYVLYIEDSNHISMQLQTVLLYQLQVINL